MLLDACHYARGKFQGGAAGAPLTRGSVRVRTASTKDCSSARKGSTVDAVASHTRIPAAARFFRGDAQGIAPGVIERNVLVLLKKAHLAHAFG